MKFLRFLFPAFLLITAAFSQPKTTQVAFDDFVYTGQDSLPEANAKSTYRNPILAGFYPDPSICRAGDDYYLINSTFAYFPGIPIFKSRDLVNWTQIGNVIHRPDQLAYQGLGVSRGIFAPSISYANGVFYVVCTMADAGGNFVVTAHHPEGPWSNPTWLNFDGIDPSIFFDGGGKAWMVNNGPPIGTPLYEGHRAIWIQEFDPVKQILVGPRTLLVNGGVDIKKKPVWIEGPHLYKYDGWYFLSCAEGGTSTNHTQVVFRSRKVDGPYEPWSENPILSQRGLDATVPFAVTSTGHANWVIGPDNKWWSVFLGVRPYEARFSPMGRETFLLPMTWTAEGWPIILEKNVRVPLVVNTPLGVQVRGTPDAALNGDFTWRARFNSSELDPSWLMLRTPTETWWKMDTAKNRLLLIARDESLEGKGNPSFLARRVQHAHFTTMTTLEATSISGVSAGLVVFQSETNYYFLATKREGDGEAIYVEAHDAHSNRVASAAHIGTSGKIKLRIEANNSKCSFAYAVGAGPWKTLLADADAKLLTTEVAGGFVGATTGLYARLDHEK